MINESLYWVFLLIGVAATFFITERLRFPFYTLLSIAFLVLATNSSDLSAQSLKDQGFYSQYRHIIEIFSISLCTYAVCQYYNQKKTWRIAQFILICGIFFYLGFYKYIPVLLQYIAGNSLNSNIYLPLGISYFSFKLIHYLIEYGRNNFRAHTLFEFLTYIFLFPVFTAGPIERFDHFQNNNLSKNRKQDLIEGSTRIIYGLIKKFIISGAILTSLLNYNTAESILIRIEEIEQYKLWGFFLITYLIIYIDFSAYSDIAIGSARLMGFKIMENFNWPILATNIAQLWQRWHMTLSGWCQNYVYLPSIGLTRNPYLAVLATFLAVGLWHGGALNWIAWGLYQGFGVSAYVAWTRLLRRRRIKLQANPVSRVTAIIATNFWMAGSFAFTMTYTDGSWSNVSDAIRLLQKYFFLI